MIKTTYIRLLRNAMLFALLLFYAVPQANAQQVAVKSNGLMWLAMIPNAGCEFVAGERSTVDLSLWCCQYLWQSGEDSGFPAGIPLLVQRSSNDA